MFLTKITILFRNQFDHYQTQNLTLLTEIYQRDRQGAGNKSILMITKRMMYPLIHLISMPSRF